LFYIVSDSLPWLLASYTARFRFDSGRNPRTQIHMDLR